MYSDFTPVDGCLIQRPNGRCVPVNRFVASYWSDDRLHFGSSPDSPNRLTLPYRGVGKSFYCWSAILSYGLLFSFSAPDHGSFAIGVHSGVEGLLRGLPFTYLEIDDVEDSMAVIVVKVHLQSSLDMTRLTFLTGRRKSSPAAEPEESTSLQRDQH